MPPHNKKNQILMEFMLLSGVLMVMSIIFIESLNQNKSLYETKEYITLKDIALKIQAEISLTSSIEDGYSRQFKLPVNISNKEYNISIRNNTLTVWTNATYIDVPILNITGNIKKSANTIAKSNGKVYIN